MTLLQPAGPLAERLRSLRIGFLGDRPRAHLDAGVASTVIGPDWEPGTSAETWLDIVVVDANAAMPGRIPAADILRSAASLGTRTVAFVDDGDTGDAAAIADLVVTPATAPWSGAAMALPPLVDLGEVSPVAALAVQDPDGLSAVRTGRRRRTRRSIRRIADAIDEARIGRSEPGWSLHVGDLPAPHRLHEVMPGIRQTFGVVDHADLHGSVTSRAAYLAALATAGVPFVLLDEPTPDLVGALGEDIARAARTPLRDLVDPMARDSLSTRIRRAAVRRFAPWGRWRDIAAALDVPLRREPLVSVILATNRPEMVGHAVEQVARQTYPFVELVAVLHGSGFADTTAATERVPGTLVVEVPESTPFGEALNIGIERSSGELVTKMDDDDWYARDHVEDLVWALEYSAADLVGKAAEWVYLEEIDTTIRRFATGAESISATIAGGTMMMRRSAIRAVGGFRRAMRHIDQGLIADVVAAGGTCYRTHGYGYVLVRRAGGHTWDAGPDYFLDQAVYQTHGLAFDAALVDEPIGSDRGGRT